MSGARSSSRPKAQHGAQVLVNGAPIGKTFSFEVASRAALANPAKAAAIRDYLKLIAQAHAWANTHQSAWAQTWSKATGLPLGIMTKAAAGRHGGDRAHQQQP